MRARRRRCVRLRDVCDAAAASIPRSPCRAWRSSAALVRAALDARRALLDKRGCRRARQRTAYARFCGITEARSRQDCSNPEELDALRKYMMSSVEEIAELEIERERDEMQGDGGGAERAGDCRRRWTRAGDVHHGPDDDAGTGGGGGTRAEWKKRFTDELKADIAALMVEISEARAVVDDFIEQGDINAVEDRLVAVQEIDSNLARLKVKGDLYKSREVLFERPETPYPALTALIKEFEPYGNMWRVAAEFSRSLPQWMNGPFTSLDPEKTTNDVDRWSRAIVKMMKSLKGVPMEVCEELRDKVTGFGGELTLDRCARNPGLRERHWKEMSEELGFPVKADASFSLTRALQLELPKHIESIERYSDFASKEFSLERTLDQMLVNWQGVSFETTPWRDTGSSILKGTEETQMLLDDQIVKTQSMRSSPYIGPFEDRVKLWEKKLSTIQEVLDQWLKMQSGWLYLEPIFGSDDIMQQMPPEGRKFRTVDSTWRKTMAKLELTSEVLTVGSDEELLGSLQKCNELLDEVNKGLSDYLETKRLAFPRFYFLSNDELLEILSETKDPLRVQPYLKKVFEAINLLEFQKNLEVTAMISEEERRVKFKKSFNPAKAGGGGEVAHRVRGGAARDGGDGVSAVLGRLRHLRAHGLDGDVARSGSSLHRVAVLDLADRIRHLERYHARARKDVRRAADGHRREGSRPAYKLQRKTLSALVVIEVHARDVVDDLTKKPCPTWTISSGPVSSATRGTKTKTESAASRCV